MGWLPTEPRRPCVRAKCGAGPVSFVALLQYEKFASVRSQLVKQHPARDLLRNSAPPELHPAGSLRFIGYLVAEVVTLAPDQH